MNETAAVRIAHALAQHHRLKSGYENTPAWHMYLRWGRIAADSIEDLIPPPQLP